LYIYIYIYNLGLNKLYLYEDQREFFFLLDSSNTQDGPRSITNKPPHAVSD